MSTKFSPFKKKKKKALKKKKEILFHFFFFYLEPSVHGLNLTVPEDAKEIIKPWDEREDNSKYLDSSVDDQVCVFRFLYNKRFFFLLIHPLL